MTIPPGSPQLSPLVQIIDCDKRSVAQKQISMESSYLNGLASMKLVLVQNLSISSSVLVRLQVGPVMPVGSTAGIGGLSASSLAGLFTVAFQMSNENFYFQLRESLSNLARVQGQQPSAETLVEAAQPLLMDLPHDNNFLANRGVSQIFHQVDHSVEFQLAPGQVLPLFVLLLPSDSMFRWSNLRKKRESVFGDNTSLGSSQHETFDLVDVVSVVSVNAFLLEPGRELPPKPDSEFILKVKARLCQSVVWSDVFDTGFVDFDDCLFGQSDFNTKSLSYVRDFTLWNRSDIELFYLIKVEYFALLLRLDGEKSRVVHVAFPADHHFTLTDYETSDVLADGPFNSISALSHRRVRIEFRPPTMSELSLAFQRQYGRQLGAGQLTTLVGDVAAWFRVENTNSVLCWCEDSSLFNSSHVTTDCITNLKPNSCWANGSGGRVKMVGTVRTQIRQDMLLVQSIPYGSFGKAPVSSAQQPVSLISMNDILDFGDCYGGCWARQQLLLKHVSAANRTQGITVQMTSDLNGADFDVVFDVKDEDDENSSYAEVQKSNERIHRDSVISVETSKASDGHGSNSSLDASQSQIYRSDADLTGHKPAGDFPLQPNSISSSRAGSPHHLLSFISRDNLENRSSESLDSIDNWMPHGPFDLDNVSSRPLTRAPTLSRIAEDGPLSFSRQENQRSLVEGIHIKTGGSRVVDVWYRPKRQAPGTENSGKLTKESFKLIFSYWSSTSAERRSVDFESEFELSSASGGTKKELNVTERKVVQCRTRACTSIISVSPKELNFGDTDVGTLKSAPIQIENLSDLPAHVELRFTSKVLSCTRGEILIMPRQSTEVKIDIYPRKVNPAYRKQISIVNAYNRDNDQVMDVLANNIDKNRVTFHSLFYRILTPTATNFIDYGMVVMNCATAKTFTIENISKKFLRVEVTSSLADEIQIFAIAPEQLSDESSMVSPTGFRSPPVHITKADMLPSLEDRKEKLLRALEKRSSIKLEGTGNQPRAKTIKSKPPSNLHTIDSSKPAKSVVDYLDLAVKPKAQHSLKETVERKKPAPPKSLPSQAGIPKRQKTVPTGLLASPSIPLADTLIAASLLDEKMRPSAQLILQHLEASAKTQPGAQPKAGLEEKFIKTQLYLKRELATAVTDGRLLPISTCDIAAESSQTIVLLFTPSSKNRPYIQGKPKKQDAKIYLRLLDFDRDVKQAPEFASLLNADLQSIPVRELMIRSTLCRSIMEIGQKNINFGLVAKHEERVKSIVIYNRADVPLQYAIRKSGSISSSDLHFGSNRMGIIRGYGKKEIDFIFKPSLPGAFAEKVVISNLQDLTNDQFVMVKAQVRKPTNFFIQSLTADFGVCMINEFSGSGQNIVISNTSNQTRTFEIRFDPKELVFECLSATFDFEVLPGVTKIHGAEGGFSKEVMEQIEHLEQKLKIAKRKEQRHKVKKIVEKLSKLKGIPPAEIEHDFHIYADGTGEEEHGDAQNNEVTDKGDVSTLIRKTDTSVILTMEPSSSRTVIAVFGSQWNVLEDGTPVIPKAPTFKVNGLLYVNELKNTDVVKKIEFSAVVCFNYESFTMALNEYPLTDGSNAGISRPSSRPGTPRIAAARSVEEIIYEPEDDPFTIEPAELDVGKLELASRTTHWITLRSNRHTEIDFSLAWRNPPSLMLPSSYPRVIIQTPKGTLSAKESRRIYFDVTPQVVGRQVGQLVAVDLDTRFHATSLVQFHGIQSEYLSFPDLPDQTLWDLGECYIDYDKKYSSVTKFRATNVSDDDICVSASSNLSQQVLVFIDPECQLACQKLFMPARSEHTLYVAIQPSTGRRAKRGECRTLVGGIKFTIMHPPEDSLSSSMRSGDEVSEQDLTVLSSRTIKFSVLLGHSAFDVAPAEFDFGVSTSSATLYKGSFTVSNVSTHLPLKIAVSASEEMIVEPKYLELVGLEVSGVSARKISFSITPSKCGLLSRSIVLTNLMTSEKQNVSVKVFIDPLILTASQEYLDWDQIYLMQNEANELVVAPNMRSLIRPVDIENLGSPKNLMAVTSKRFSVVVDDMDIEAGRDSCNVPFQMQPNAKRLLMISLREDLGGLPSELVKKILGGERVSFTDRVLLRDERTQDDVKMIRTRVTCGMSLGRIEPSVLELGDLSFRDQWEDVPFTFEVENLSTMPLVYEIEESDLFDIKLVDGQPVRKSSFAVPPRGKHTVSAILNSGKLSTNAAEAQLVLKNMYNPSNTMILAVQVAITSLQLQFSRLVTGELVLPPLYYPQPPNPTPCDSWFSIQNASAVDSRFEIGVELAPEIAEFVAVEVLSRFSNSLLKGGISLIPNGTIEVRVRASIKSENRRLTDISQHLTNPNGITFGRLFVTTKATPDGVVNRFREEIPLRGTILEGPSFELSDRRIEFFCGEASESDSEGEMDDIKNEIGGSKSQVESILLTNLYSNFPLQFRVTQEMPSDMPMEYLKISPLDADGIGYVPPGERLRIDFELLSENHRPTDDIKVHVIDLNAISRNQQTIIVSIQNRAPRRFSDTEDELFSPVSLKDMISPVPVSPGPVSEVTTNASFIEIRGCKKLSTASGPDLSPSDFRYELDLGQLDLGVTGVSKKIVLENSSTLPIRYSIKMIPEAVEDLPWMSVNRTNGVLSPPIDGKRDKLASIESAHTIIINFIARVQDVYTGYLIIENSENPEDTKYIRVTMEVVKAHSMKRTEDNVVFDVLANGVNLELDYIEMRDIYYFSEYSSRSLLILNRESVPLEFTLKLNMPDDDPSELIFSLSRTTNRLFRTLTVEPGNQVRVFLRFWPAPKNTAASSLIGSSNSNTWEMKQFQISVNCRLVKDYQKTIYFRAKCAYPSMEVSTQEFMFNGVWNDFQAEGGESTRWTSSFSPESREFVIKNISDTAVKYRIMNDTRFFIIENRSQAGSGIVAARGSSHIIVRPNLETITRFAKMLRKEKYVQEHMTIYNADRPSEKFWMILQISFGKFTLFHLPPTSKASQAYDTVEKHIIAFLCDMRVSSSKLKLMDDEAKRAAHVRQHFQLTYILDQLVYYGTKEYTGETYFHLAILLFRGLLDEELPLVQKNQDVGDRETSISSIIHRLGYFLSFFPYQSALLAKLRGVHKLFIEKQQQLQQPKQ